MPDIGDIGDGGPATGRPFIVGPTWQASEAFLPENLPDGNGAQRAALMGQVAADVVDREILLAQRDDPIAQGIGFGRGLWSFGRAEEEVTAGILAKLVDQDAEAPWGIAEAAGGLFTGQSLDEIGAKGLVLTMGGVGGFKEEAGEAS